MCPSRWLGASFIDLEIERVFEQRGGHGNGSMEWRGESRYMRRALIGCWLAATLSFWTASSRGDETPVVIIGNASVQQRSLPLETVRAIFAMRQRTLPDGQAVHVFVLSDDNPIHELFSKKILGVYPHQLRLAWDRAVFSGTGQAPNEVPDEAAMLKAVTSTPGGVGYVKRSSLTNQVRVLDIE